MTIYTIQGESGKAWGAAGRPASYFAVSGAVLRYQSLGIDTLTLTITPRSIVDYTLPDYGQKVELFVGSTRHFVGHVTNIITGEASTPTLTVVVSGAMWWMQRIGFTSTVTDDTGATATRLQARFGTAASGVDLRAAILSALTQMQTLGVPIDATNSTCATMFQVPRVTLNQSTCGQVLNELVTLCPDAMVRFDYSTATPTVHISRRGSATATNFAAGSLDEWEVNPIIELNVTSVSLPYLTRNAAGKGRFATQTSAGTPEIGKTQIITISGEELDTYIPKSTYERVFGRTFADLRLAVETLDGRLLAVPTNTFVVPETVETTWTFRQSSVSTITYTTPLPKFYGPNGIEVSAPAHYLSAEDMPLWMSRGYGFTPVNVKGQLFYRHPKGTAYPAWFSSLPMVLITYDYGSSTAFVTAYELWSLTYEINAYASANEYHWTGTTRTGTGTATKNKIVLATSASSIDGFYDGAKIEWKGTVGATDTVASYDGATRTVTLTNAWNAPLTPGVGNTYKLEGHPFYNPGDYSFIAPPSGLADALLAAQNWTPYEGRLEFVNDDCDLTRYSGRKINITGHLTALSTMGALVAGESKDLATGRCTIQLGVPPQNDYRNLMEKIRKTPQDNIVFDL